MLLAAACLALAPLATYAQSQPVPGSQTLQVNHQPLLLTGRPFLPTGLGIMGWDISWPQCPGETLPADPVSFIVVGINGGRPLTSNPCFLQQFTWAVQNSQSTPQIYMNSAGLPDGWTSPECAAGDLPCDAYYYGKASAAYATNLAQSYDANAPTWWIDVETANYWTTDQFLNDRVLDGIIEYLQGTGHHVGIYSIPKMWDELMGDFSPGLPVWTAGAANLSVAPDRCSGAYGFGGGQVIMVQYVSEALDANYTCILPNWAGRRVAIVGGIAAGGG